MLKSSLIAAFLICPSAAYSVELTYKVESVIPLNAAQMDEIKDYYQSTYPALQGTFCYADKSCETVEPVRVSRLIGGWGEEYPEVHCSDLAPGCSFGFEEAGGSGPSMPAAGPVSPGSGGSDQAAMQEMASSILNGLTKMTQMGFSAEGNFTQKWDAKTGRQTEKTLSFKITGELGKGSSGK